MVKALLKRSLAAGGASAARLRLAIENVQMSPIAIEQRAIKRFMRAPWKSIDNR
jgi:hypothetical protein